MKTKLMAAKTKAKNGLMKCAIAASPILSMMGMPVIARADGGDDLVQLQYQHQVVQQHL